MEEFFSRSSRGPWQSALSWESPGHQRSHHPLCTGTRTQWHPATPGRGSIPGVQQSPADPSLSPPSSSSQPSPEGLTGFRAAMSRMAVGALSLLSWCRGSGAHRHADCCQRDGPASRVSHAALITSDQLRLESSCNPSCGKLLKEPRTAVSGLTSWSREPRELPAEETPLPRPLFPLHNGVQL